MIVQELDPVSKMWEDSYDNREFAQAVVAVERLLKEPQFSNDFSGHQGRPGQVGGSLPRSLVEANKLVPIINPTREWKTWIVKSGKHAGETRSNWVGGKWVMKDTGKPLPAHITKPIPPAWEDAHINPEPGGKYMAAGVDTKGRPQKFRTEEFEKTQALKKYAKAEDLENHESEIEQAYEHDLKSRDKEKREAASALKVIHKTGFRVGGESDTGAEKQAYGTTTLEGRHIVVLKNGTFIKCVAKKGTKVKIGPIEDIDPETAKMLRERATAAGPDGKIFDTSDAKVREYSKTLDGGGFTPKDFRTMKGTRMARELIARKPERTANLKEYKERVKAIATTVSEHLGNTPSIALKDYINPTVFHKIMPSDMRESAQPVKSSPKPTVPIEEKFDLNMPRPKGVKSGEWPDYVGDKVIWRMLEKGNYTKDQIADTVVKVAKEHGEKGWTRAAARDSIPLVRQFMVKYGLVPKLQRA